MPGERGGDMRERKVLFVASIEKHFEGFHTPYLAYFKEHGYEVHTAAKGENTIACVDKHYDICFERNPYSLKNRTCYKLLKKLIDENNYHIIHCHTPVASALTRLAARRQRKNGTVVIYTAHGFHFYKKAPVVLGTIFRFLEKGLSLYTDHLLTINQEDYEAIKRYGFKPGAYHKVCGVGVDETLFIAQTPENRQQSRQELGIPQQAFVLVFAAEYSKRKNQQMLLKTVSLLKERIPQVLLLMPGEGVLRGEYEEMIRDLGIGANVWLMGYRSDMESLLLAADVAVTSSIQEGLPINIVEAMVVSLPVVATRIRGHVDLVMDSKNGFLVPIDDVKSMADSLYILYKREDIAAQMRHNTQDMVKPYLLSHAKIETCEIYDKIIGELKETEST